MITKEFPIYVVQLALEEYLKARNESFDIDALTDQPEVHYFTKNKEGSHYDKKALFSMGVPVSVSRLISKPSKNAKKAIWK